MRTDLMAGLLALSAAALGAAPPAQAGNRWAQAAEGSYPGALVCDQEGGKPFRGPVTIEILSGRATYTFRTDLGTETGSGRMAGSQLALIGKGSGRGGYEARYLGDVNGRGGLLTGTQTGKGFRRACQISLGLGRG